MTPKRDLLWEALVQVCGADASEMTKSERGRYNKALKDLREVNATPEQIKARAGRFRMKYPSLDVTPTALAAHWSSLKGATPAARPQPRSEDLWDGVIEYEIEAELTPEQRQANIDRLHTLMNGIGRV